MRIRVIVATGFIFSLALAACGGESTPPAEAPTNTEPTTEPAPAPAPEATEPKADAPKADAPKAEEPAPAPAKKKISELIASGGTWAFSLADSPDAKKAVDDGCAKKAKGDAKKQDACVADAQKAADGEGFRYEKDDKDNWWWVSFTTTKGKEVIVNKVMFKIATDGDVGGSAIVKPEGKDKGKKPMAKLPAEITIDMPDEGTTVMTDPKKGKLTFKKK